MRLELESVGEALLLRLFNGGLESCSLVLHDSFVVRDLEPNSDACKFDSCFDGTLSFRSTA